MNTALSFSSLDSTNTTNNSNTVAVGVDLGTEFARISLWDKNVQHPVVGANPDGKFHFAMQDPEQPDQKIVTPGQLELYLETFLLPWIHSSSHTTQVQMVFSVSRPEWKPVVQKYGSLLSSSMAIQMAYGCSEDSQQILVLDGGASGIHATVLEQSLAVMKGLWQTKSSHHQPNVQGKALLEPLAQDVGQQFEQKCRFNRGEVWQSKKARQKLIHACQEALPSFQRLNNVTIHIDGLYEGMDANIAVSKIKYEHLSTPLANQVKQFCQESLNDQDGPNETPTAKVIDQVLVAGGLHNWLTPIVQSIFGAQKVVATTSSNMDPSQAVTIGCCLQSQLLLEQPSQKSTSSAMILQEPTMRVPKSPFAIGWVTEEIDNHGIQTIIPAGTPLPCQLEYTLELPDSCTSAKLVQVMNENQTQGLVQLNDLSSTSTTTTTPTTVTKLLLHLTRQGRLRVSCWEEESTTAPTTLNVRTAAPQSILIG